MTQVQPFSFHRLPQYTHSQVNLQNQLVNSYWFLESKSRVMERIVAGLEELFKSPASLHFTHVESQNLEEFAHSLPQNILLGLVQLEPMGKKAALLFETHLVQLMVLKMLTREPVSQEQFIKLQFKPVTPLEEAVVEYILVVLLEVFSQAAATKNFNVLFSEILTDPGKLMGVFSNNDPYAVFSIKLSWLDRDFFLKLVLPLPAAQKLGLTERSEPFLHYRFKQFENLTVPFELTAAHVELKPSEIEQLAPGDIILFDESSISLDGPGVSGTGVFKPELSEGHGYEVSLNWQDHILKGTVVSAF